MLTSTDTKREHKVQGAATGATDQTRSSTRAPVSLVLVAEAVALGEALIIVLCAIIAKLIYVDQVISSGQTLLQYAQLGICTAGVAYFVMRALELYEPAELVRPSISTTRILVGLLFSFLMMVAVLFLLKVSDTYSRGWLVSWLLLSMAAVLAERRLMRTQVRRLVAEGRVRQRVAVLGTPDLLAKTLETLSERCPEIDVIAAFPAAGPASGLMAGSPDAATLDQLIALGQRNQCDKIVIALPLDHPELRAATARLSVLPVDVVVLPNPEPLPLRVHGFGKMGGLPALKVQAAPLSERELLAKSIIDTVLAAVALVLLSPVFLAIAVAIKLDSKGPVFFKQRRHGFNNGIFWVVKFRTMTVMEDGVDFRQATANDQRVTKIGRFLRRTSLDELPQLWNVLMGDMSLVGPRPHPLALNDRFAKVWPDYANRHRVKPGLTGLAQVMGFRGETSEPRLMRRRALLDLRYIENWSLGLDLWILFKTVAIVLSGRNAY
jgi:Undecaprenyl-phosphate glucose phosphotransferase